MKICFLHTVAIDPQKGGIEKISSLLADALAARGNEVFYLSMMDVFGENCDRERQFFFPDSSAIYSAKNEVFLKNFLRDKKIDCVIFQAGDDKRVPFPQLYSQCGARLIVAVHTDPEYYRAVVRNKIVMKYGERFAKAFPCFIALKTFLRSRKHKKIYRGNAMAADAVVLLSQKFVPAFAKYIRPADRQKITAIPNFVNPPADVPADKARELLYVGRMNIDEKRVDLLLRIWAKLQSAFPQWRLRLVGDGSDRERLQRLSRELAVERVSFEGFQNPENYYRNAAIFCLTSAFEGFGLAMVEAASYACVPVAFNSYASAEEIISDGENGFLVPAFDTDAYAGTLARLMADENLRRRLSVAARGNAGRFSLPTTVARWETLFEKII